MPNVNGEESTSPPNGGNVEVEKLAPSSAKSSRNQTTYQTKFLADGSHSLQDVSLGELDPTKQTETNGKAVACSTAGISQTARELVIRELGVTSSVFIGPACRPEPSIEKELSDFYKELEKAEQISVDADIKSLDEQTNPPYKPETPKESHIPVVVTDHSRAYRPYPDPQGCSQQDLKRWRPRSQNNRDAAHPERWFPPPPSPSWTLSEPRGDFYPPVNFEGPIIFPLNTRSQESFFSVNSNNTPWGPWQGPLVPLDRWHDPRGFQTQEHSGFLEDYERPEAQPLQWSYREDHNHRFIHRALVLILLRGLPGSGKSTLGRELMFTGPNGVILSTDDYFFQENRYCFDPALLSEAHDWNQKRAEQAMLDGCSPVIIDNTNVKAWEMKPYVQMALENGYRVDFLEPETQWKFDPIQLEKRNKHRVPRETIAKMLNGFERPINVDVVMSSVTPPHKSKAS